MSRRHVVMAAVLAAALVPATGAVAKTSKPKVKVLKGSYSVTAVPDPTMEATGELNKHCMNVDPQAANSRAVKLPGSGTLKVVLDSPDPSAGKVFDWDLYVFDAKGNVLASSDGGTAHEETFTPGLRKSTVTIKVCNLMGEPTANVSYVYTYR